MDLMEFGNGRASGDLLAVVAASRRIPQDPAALAALGLADWDVISLLVLSNGGMAEFWTGDLVSGGEAPAGRRGLRPVRWRTAPAPQRGGPPGPAAVRAG